MADLNNLISPFFLSDKEIRKIIELVFFSYRDFTAGPDQILEKLNFGRAHHRVIYFVGKKDKITINGAYCRAEQPYFLLVAARPRHMRAPPPGHTRSVPCSKEVVRGPRQCPRGTPRGRRARTTASGT